MPPQGPPQMPPQQYYAPQQPYMPQQAQPPKKSNVLMWVLIGVGGLVLMFVLALGVGSFFIYRTVKNAGFDADLMRSNPGLAMAKMVTSLNPDTEVVSTNDSAGTVVVREKSTGKVMTMKFDPDKKSMVIIGDDGNQVSINASGDAKNGTLNIQGPDGNLSSAPQPATRHPPGYLSIRDRHRKGRSPHKRRRAPRTPMFSRPRTHQAKSFPIFRTSSKARASR